jgi:hypothetical protein
MIYLIDYFHLFLRGESMRKLSRSAHFLSFAIAAVALAAPAIAATPARPLVVEHNHNLTYGTFLGGVGDDAARGAVVLSDGSIIVAGNFTNLQTRPINNAVPNPNPLNAVANAKGKLVKLTADGRILAEVTLGNRIDDIDRSPASNQIVVGGDFGVVVLNAANLSVVWSKQLPEVAGSGSPDGGQTRVAISKSNQVIALRQNTLNLFNAQGNQKAKTVLKGKLAADGVTKIPDSSSFVTDVAIDPNDQRVYTVGFSNRRNNQVNKPVQVPFLYSLETTALNIQTKTWDYDAQTLVRPGLDKKGMPTTLNDMADSRLYQVVIGGDGKLTVAGESAGGNSVFRWNGKTLPTDSRNDANALTLVAYDAYSNTYNSKSPHLLYYAKVDIATGVVAAGQYAVPRLPEKSPGQTGLANTFRMKEGGLAVDAQGNIFIAGVSAYGTPERDLNKFNGVTVGPYSSANMEDMIMLMVSPDLKSRLRWTPFAKGAGGGGVMNAIVPTSNGRVVVVGTATHGELMTTSNATRPNPFDPAPNKVDNARDVYLGILQIP